MRDGPGYLMDVQADMLNRLNTRVVVPLLPLSEAPKPAKVLNPQFVCRLGSCNGYSIHGGCAIENAERYGRECRGPP